MISPIAPIPEHTQIFDALKALLPSDLNNRIETIMKDILLNYTSLEFNILTLRKLPSIDFVEAQFITESPETIVCTCNYAFFANSPISPTTTSFYSFSKTTSPDELRIKIIELITPRISNEDRLYNVATYLTTSMIHIQAILDRSDTLFFAKMSTPLGTSFVLYFTKDYELDITSLIPTLPETPAGYTHFHPFSEVYDSDPDLDPTNIYSQLIFPLPL